MTFSIATVKVFVMAMVMQNGIAVGTVVFKDENGIEQRLEYRIEGCGDLGNPYASRGGMTTMWVRGGSRLVDKIATHVCERIENAQKWM